MLVNEVGNLCIKLKLIGRYKQDVTEFSQQRGEKAALEVLRQIQRERDNDVKRGNKWGKSATTLWKELSQKYIGAEAGRKRKAKEDRERAKQEAAYYESKKSNYTPNAETLKKQLEALRDAGKVVGRWYPNSELPRGDRPEQEFECGVAGLKIIHGLVEQAKDLPEDRGVRMGSSEPVSAGKVLSNEGDFAMAFRKVG